MLVKVPLQSITSYEDCLALSKNIKESSDHCKKLSNQYKEMSCFIFKYSAVFAGFTTITYVAHIVAPISTSYEPYLQIALLGCGSFPILASVMGVYGTYKSFVYSEKANKKDELCRFVEARAYEMMPAGERIALKPKTSSQKAGGLSQIGSLLKSRKLNKDELVISEPTLVESKD